MLRRLTLFAASLLFRFAFPLYRPLYFWYKSHNDKNELELLRKIIPRGTAILDIGANIGFYSCFLAGLTGMNGRVYAFEPDPLNFKRLKREVGRLPNVTPLHKAIAAAPGRITLYTSTLLNVDHRTYMPERFHSSFEVDKTSVDCFINSKFDVGLIKMDIQGFEMEALNGMVHTLKTNPDIILLTELWPYGLMKAGSSAAEVWTFLNDLGFLIYKVDSSGLSPLPKDEVLRLPQEFFKDIHIIASRNKLTS